MQVQFWEKIMDGLRVYALYSPPVIGFTYGSRHARNISKRMLRVQMILTEEDIAVKGYSESIKRSGGFCVTRERLLV